MMARRQATRGKRRPHRLVVAASASLLTFVGLASVTPVTGVWADDPITLLVHNRPPLYVIDGDTVTGSVAAPAFQAFLSAGISAEWQVMPSNRQLKIVKDNASRVCAVGWFRTVEREKFALFTKSIFKGQPEVAIIRSDDARVWGHPTLTSLFLDERLIMGRKLGYLYGAKIERFADEHSTPSVTTSQNAEGMARMLLSGRFDYFFSDPEEQTFCYRQMNLNGRASQKNH